MLINAYCERKKTLGYENLKFDKNAEFLVTGGAGFIGSNLCEAIIGMGYKVRCLDNLSTGKRENVDFLISEKGFTYIEGDIRDFATCMNACEGVDFVLHHAALVSVPWSIKEPLLFTEVNIVGTQNMMEAARLNKIKKFVYASSSAVYGDDQTLPKLEGKEGNPLSPYAANKKANEENGKQYTEIYGLDTYGLRYFNIFGKRQDPHGAYAAVIPKFIRLLINDEVPIIYGDGKQTRDFTYIDNAIEANLRACLAASEVAGQAFNIGSGRKDSLIGIYHELAMQLAKDFEPSFRPEREGDIMHSIADITKAKKELGYNPNTSFSNGIRKTIEWYMENN